jgi:hypothetical protein
LCVVEIGCGWVAEGGVCVTANHSDRGLKQVWEKVPAWGEPTPLFGRVCVVGSLEVSSVRHRRTQGQRQAANRARTRATCCKRYWEPMLVAFPDALARPGRQLYSRSGHFLSAAPGCATPLPWLLSEPSYPPFILLSGLHMRATVSF